MRGTGALPEPAKRTQSFCLRSRDSEEGTEESAHPPHGVALLRQARHLGRLLRSVQARCVRALLRDLPAQHSPIMARAQPPIHHEAYTLKNPFAAQRPGPPRSRSYLGCLLAALTQVARTDGRSR